MAEEKKKPGFARAVVVPAVLAALVLWMLGGFLGAVLVDHGTIASGFIVAWAVFAIGRGLAYFDQPPKYGVFVRSVATGTAIGIAGSTFLRAIFTDGPGWPATPWWVVAAGTGFGLTRAHRALLRAARETDQDAPRWLGLVHPKDAQALAVLLGGYVLLGVAGFSIFRAFSGIIPNAGQLLTIGIAVYALQGARLMLRFAGEERASRGTGVVAWLKANALQNAIVVLLLVGYAVFRGDLSNVVPFFPLVEFGLGVAVFAFVLARLRARMRRDGTLLATASEARDHERVVTDLRDAEHDDVARPLTRFLETGVGLREYADAVARGLAPEDPRTTLLVETAMGHREPPRPPVLELPWMLAAGGAMTIGLAIAALAFGFLVFKAEMPYPLILALLFVALGVYSLQDAARAHHRLGMSVAVAAAGTLLLFLDFLFFLAAAAGSLASVPGVVWAIAGGIALAMLVIPALVAWRAHRRLAAGPVVDARRTTPLLEHKTELTRVRKRATAMALAAFIILLPVPWLAGWLAEREIVPPDLPEFMGDFLGAAIWGIAAFGAAAVVRFYGLTRGKPRLVAREKANRDRRLQLHRNLMKTIDRM